MAKTFVTYSNLKHKVLWYMDGATPVYKDEALTVDFSNGSAAQARFSYNAPFNSITGQFTTQVSLARLEIRVALLATGLSGPESGTLLKSWSNLAANVTKNFEILITSEAFPASAAYIIGFFAQNDSDYSYDSTQLYLVTGPSPYLVNNNTYSVHDGGLIADTPKQYKLLEYLSTPSESTAYIDPNYTFTSNNIDITIVTATARNDAEMCLVGMGGALEVGYSSTLNRIMAYSKDKTTLAYNNMPSIYNGLPHIFNFWQDGSSRNFKYDNETAVTSSELATFSGGSVYVATYLPTNLTYTFKDGKIYKCIIKDNGIVVRHLVPCRCQNNNALGMLDLVNNVFYSNANETSDNSGVYRFRCQVSADMNYWFTGYATGNEVLNTMLLWQDYYESSTGNSFGLTRLSDPDDAVDVFKSLINQGTNDGNKLSLFLWLCPTNLTQLDRGSLGTNTESIYTITWDDSGMNGEYGGDVICYSTNEGASNTYLFSLADMPDTNSFSYQVEKTQEAGNTGFVAGPELP